MQVRLAGNDEKRARDPLTHAAWGAKLDVDEYVAREARLRAHPWPTAGMRTWLLVDGDVVFASLETFLGRAFVDGNEAAVELVASVYTAPEHRKRGHATRLMDGVVARLEDEGRAVAVVLYSDVGDAQYARSGFRVVRSEEWTLPAGGEAPAVDRSFDESAVPSLDLVPIRTGVVVAPTGEQLDWHVERERIYRDRLEKPALPARGCEVGSARVVWAAEWKTERLLVLAATPGEGLGRALRAAQAVAARVGLREVVCWTADALSPFVDVPARPRDGSLTMVRPLGPGPETVDFVLRGGWV